MEVPVEEGDWEFSPWETFTTFTFFTSTPPWEGVPVEELSWATGGDVTAPLTGSPRESLDLKKW
jgi:hypothetical protein